MNRDICNMKELFGIRDYDTKQVPEHEGGRNLIFICEFNGIPRFVIRISSLGDRTEEEYQAEVDFVHFLAENGAPVADIYPSVNGKFVEKVDYEGKEAVVSLFAYASGMLISDNGYQYREGTPLSEYFYNTGKVLGQIHRLSKGYTSTYMRQDYFDIYNMEYIGGLIPKEYAELKQAIACRLVDFKKLSRSREEYGLIHFDFSDGNYHINMSNGEITVFDFDNCMNCWYMFDLANLWMHGVGWYQFEEDKEKRRACMKEYFDTIIEGYRSETDISDEMLEKLPKFIDMVLIENIVDECECCRRAGEELDYEDIEEAAECLINEIPFAGFFE
ncbi:MAG: phosphotransferase [Clostridiales bacterium]|nr:phosphotransferase [Clostridiales bacterium]